MKNLLQSGQNHGMFGIKLYCQKYSELLRINELLTTRIWLTNFWLKCSKTFQKCSIICLNANWVDLWIYPIHHYNIRDCSVRKWSVIINKGVGFICANIFTPGLHLLSVWNVLPPVELWYWDGYFADNKWSFPSLVYNNLLLKQFTTFISLSSPQIRLSDQGVYTWCPAPPLQQ